MSIYNREEQYIQLLSQREYSVKELADTLFISEPTVRRDVIALKEKELVTSSRGMVRLVVKYADRRIPLYVRDLEYNEAKKQIAIKAASLVKDGNVVMLDASTTAYHLLPHLANLKNILLITSGAKTAVDAASFGIKTICTGGELTTESYSFVGTDTENLLLKYNADIAFFSCRGIDEKGRVTDSSILENSVRKIMMKNSRKNYLLCDKSKFGKIYVSTLCEKDDVDGVITD